MKYAVTALGAVVVLALAAPAQAGPRLPIPPDPSTAWCRQAARTPPIATQIPGFGQAVAACIHGHRMSRDARNCLIAVGITTAGVAIGGVIAAAAARAIAGDVVKTGVAVCVGLIVAT